MMTFAGHEVGDKDLAVTNSGEHDLINNQQQHLLMLMFNNLKPTVVVIFCEQPALSLYLIIPLCFHK